MHTKKNGTALIRGSLSRRFFILTLVLTRGERSYKGKKCSVLNFVKKLSLKHLVPQFLFQTIHYCLRSKIPIVTWHPFWANMNKLGLFLQKMKFLLMANGEQQNESGEGSLQCHSRVVKWSAFLSLLLPCLPGPLGDSSVPSPWATERCAQFSEGWVVRGDRRWASAALLQDWPYSRAFWRGRQTVYAPCVHQKCKGWVGVFIQNQAKTLGTL